MSASAQTRVGRLLPGLKNMAIAVLSFLITGFVISFFIGAPFLAGFLGGLDQAVAWFLLVAAVVYIGWYSDDISAGFLFVSLALLGLSTLVLPTWATAPFRPLSAFLFGEVIQINPVHFAVLTGTGVIAYWALKTWLFGRGKRPAAVANRVRTNSESLVRQYAKIAATVAGFLVTAVFIFTGQFGDAFGELFTQAANSPVLNSFIATIVGYVAAFFTTLPFISEFGTAEFLVVMLALFAIGVGAKYSNALN